MPYIRESCRIGSIIYHVDTLQFGRKYQTSVFIYWDGDICLIMDVGTSNDVDMLLHHLSREGIPGHRIAGIVLTHYHFDHAGGVSELRERMKKLNPEFKVFLTRDTLFKLQNYESHLTGAGTTYGDKVGSMNGLPEEACCLIEKNGSLPLKLEDGYELSLVETSGHTDDHVAPTLFKDGRAMFCYSGESCGAVCRDPGLFSMPTSMPPGFKFERYMKSSLKIASLYPDIMGFGHFGAVTGREEVQDVLARHYESMQHFREVVVQAYREEPETRYVVQKVTEFFKKSGTISPDQSKPNSNNVIFAFTYGMMVDLGYRRPKYEQ